MKCLRLAQGIHRRTNMVYIETMGSTWTTNKVWKYEAITRRKYGKYEGSMVSTKYGKYKLGKKK